MANIGVVVLNWNAARDTINCVLSVRALAGKNFDLVIVDNASTDDSANNISLALPSETLIRNELNLGYAGGNNRGVKELFARDCQFVLILNNDCVLQSIEWAEELLAKKGDRVAIFGLAIEELSNGVRLDFSGLSRDLFTILFSLCSAPPKCDTSGNRFLAVERISGAAMVINRRFAEAVGLMDERYFLYCEEIDYCLRARNGGWVVLYERPPFVSVRHDRVKEYE